MLLELLTDHGAGDADHAMTQGLAALAEDLKAGTAPLPRPSRDLRARFAHVETWVFDLDNTLYPRRQRPLAANRRRASPTISP